VTAPLSVLPSRKRRQVALVFGAFAVLFGAVGVLALVGRGSAAVDAFAAVALAVALLLGSAAFGLLHSVRVDARRAAAAQLDASIDAAINEALVKQGYGSMCSCGHEHDPTELHVVDAEPCGHDGTGAACERTCETCVLAAMRPSASGE
jgi:hypothetical protein